MSDKPDDYQIRVSVNGEVHRSKTAPLDDDELSELKTLLKEMASAKQSDGGQFCFDTEFGWTTFPVRNIEYITLVRVSNYQRP